MRFFLLAALFFAALSCDTSDPPTGGEPSVQFAAVDASCTEVWLQVKLLAGVPQRTIRIQRDSTTILNATLGAAETLVVDEGLLPNRTYQYACVLTGGFLKDSISVSITTLDTTSHNWSFVVDTIGGPGSSLRDVWIASENDVWAVGELDPGENTYNAVRWDGIQWHPISVLFSVCNDQGNEIGNGPFASTCVFGFNAADVWFSGGGGFTYWNGSTFERSCLLAGIIQGQILKMWGTSSSNLFAVGRNGTITHYNGTTWQRMLSPTDVDLLDVWGSPDGSVVWACGHYSDQFGNYLLRYLSGVWEIIYDGTASRFSIRSDSLSGAYSSVYARNSRDVFVAASAGLYNTKANAHGEAKRYSFTSGFFPGFPWRVRGDGAELFVVGEYYMIAHFNGVTMQHYPNLMGDGRLWSVDQKGDLMTAGGYSFGAIDRRGIVVRGTR